MFTTVRLVKTSFISYNYHFIIVMVTRLKFYSHSNFKVCSTILLTIVTMLSITFLETYSSHTWRSMPFDQLLPILRLQQPPFYSLSLSVQCFQITHGCENVQPFSVWCLSTHLSPWNPPKTLSVWAQRDPLLWLGFSQERCRASTLRFVDLLSLTHLFLGGCCSLCISEAEARWQVLGGCCECSDMNSVSKEPTQ